MQFNIFLIISTLLVVKPTVNGLFLSQVGAEGLPIAYMLVAVFAALVSYLYSRYLSKRTLYSIIQITLLLSVIIFIIFGILLRFSFVAGWILYAFYIWVAIFAVLTASQFWILANVIFNAREAKRLFGFIGAGAISGGIFGGYLTTMLAEVIGAENLVFIGAGFLTICLPITRIVWKQNEKNRNKRLPSKRKFEKVDRPLSLILQNKHLTYLAGIVGISVIVARLVDFQFSAIASEHFSDKDQLTAFFGFWFSTFNLISLAIQLLLTRRVVGTLGVGYSLLYLPGSILIGAIILLFAPVLWAGIIIKLCDGSLKQSINKAAVELLALPIPVEIKSQTKTFIDVVVDSVATGLSGLILIFVVRGMDLSVRSISVIIILLIGVWIFFILRVRKEYLKSFRLRVETAGGPTAKKELKYNSILKGWKHIINEGSAEQIVFALRKLHERPVPRFAPDIINLLQHPSKRVRLAALKSLYVIRKVNAIKKVQLLIQDESADVVIAAFDYLISRTPGSTNMLLSKYLKDSDYKVHLGALVSLAEESADNPKLSKNFGIEQKIRQHLLLLPTIEDPDKKQFYKIALLKAIGFSGMPHLFPTLESMLEDDNKEVVKQAILSVGDTLHPHFISTLVWLLGHPVHRESAQIALAKYGPEMFDILFNYAYSESADLASIQNIPGVIATDW